MTVIDALLLVLWLATLGGAAALLWHRQRVADDEAAQAEAQLAMAREAAARQLLQLRAQLAEQEEEVAKIPAIRAEVGRLRSKYRRLYVRYIELAGKSLKDATDSVHPDLAAPETSTDHDLSAGRGTRSSEAA